MRRNVLLLAACQALLNTANALVLSTAALIGVALAPSANLITLPLGLMFLATMSTTLPASLLMKRIGRQAGFLLGSGLAVCGAALCTVAVHNHSFVAYCGGLLLLGMFNAIGQFYRFTAAEVATEEYRSRAISWVMAGGVIAAFTGPNLASLTRDLIEPAAFSGSYASLVAVYLLTMLLLLGLRVPPPPATERANDGRPLWTVARQPRFVVAALGGMVSYGVMNLLMTATPLAMAGCGYPFSDTAWVIQWHVFGMFAPSFFTGHVIRRLGALNVVMVGGVLLLACVAVNLHGDLMLNFWSALVLLGVGWNFMFVGSTTLLTECYGAAEKAKAQGLNDFLVFGTVAMTATSSGALHHALGWATLNVTVTPFIFASLLAAWWLRRRPASAAATA